MEEKIKVGFVSLGCPKNQVDTEVMLKLLHDDGFEITAEDTEADVIIVNTCAFIESAKTEAIDNILDVAWLKQNGNLKKLIVCGCLAERYRDEILAEIPEVDAVFSLGFTQDVAKLVKIVWENDKESQSFLCELENYRLGGERILTTPSHMAYLKISEGCDNRCSYCVIPKIRGKFRSRVLDELVDEARELVKLGVKELVLVAQDTTRYGEDLYGEPRLASLIERISNETDVRWIRVLYCYPERVDDALCEQFAKNPKLVKYIDLPIQHVNDEILKKMNRRGGRAAIERAVAKLRAACPKITIRTTVICGFPSETQAQFEELCEYLKATKFDKLGAFAYSREEDTPAARMRGQIEESEKQNRVDIIMNMQSRISAEKLQAQIGSELLVLNEGYDVVSAVYFGRSESDAAEIDGKVYFSAPKSIPEGEFVRVKVTETVDYDLYGEAVIQK